MIHAQSVPVSVLPDSLRMSPKALTHRILTRLEGFNRTYRIFAENAVAAPAASAVLFALGPGPEGGSEPCLILTQRSTRVRQPGDLCCPGGSISPRTDRFLSALVRLPGAPLSRWPGWKVWRKRPYPESRSLGLLLAAALREGFEEMRLNPMGVRFLGPLPPQQLVMFRRIIFPMVCWIPRQKKFHPNWEVEKLVHIPLKDLLNPARYALCRMQSEVARKNWDGATVKDFPCYLPAGSNPLWGATFRITAAFLELVFGFRHPDPESLPLVHCRLGENYLTGNRPTP